MSERLILFSPPMVRAILAGQKTMTRRVVRPQPDFGTAHAALGGDTSDAVPGVSPACFGSCVGLQQGRGFGYVIPNIRSPYGAPGDLLWVRETWAAGKQFDDVAPRDIPDGAFIHYAASHPGDMHIIGMARGRWRRSIHMPRWASRLTLRVTDVRVERVQDITPTDALAEGCGRTPCAACDEAGCEECNHEGWHREVDVFRAPWDTLNAKRGHGWDTNPWVWVVSFERAVEVIP